METQTLDFRGMPYNIVRWTEEEIAADPDHLTCETSPKNVAFGTSRDGSFFDESEVREWKWHVKPGSFVVDVGSNYGSYAITAALQGAKVLALEPNDLCRKILLRNLEANPEFMQQIQVYPVGCHAKTGWTHPVTGKYSAEKNDPLLLHVQTLDDILEQKGISQVDYMKIDVEGAELGVLQGAVKLLERSHPKMLIEEHERVVPGIGNQVQEFLSKFGYKGEKRPYSHCIHAWYE